MKSIRRYLQTALLLVMILVMGIAALASYLSSAHEIDEIFDARLAQYTRLLASYEVRNVEAGIPVPLKHSEWIGHKYEGKISFQIWESEKKLLLASQNALHEPLGPFQEGFHNGVNEKQGMNEKSVRVFVLEHEGRWYMAAERLEIRNELVRDIATTSVLPALVGTVLVMVLMGLTLSRGFLPLQQLAAAITRRRADDFSALAMSAVPLEVQPLVDNLNALFVQMQASLEREKRFSADAAHELKTPLAALKLHIANLQAVTPTTDVDALQRIANSVEDIQRIVEQLLLLNRLVPHQLSRMMIPVQLLPLCRDVLAQEALVALDKQQELQLDANDESISVTGDATLLQVMLRNLIRNAILYTPVGGMIQIGIHRSDQQVIVDVVDNGQGIPVEERERVFERFHRGSGDAHDSGVAGSGLGLAIVREIIQLHGGTISLLTPESGQGLHVHVVLPVLVPVVEPADESVVTAV